MVVGTAVILGVFQYVQTYQWKMPGIWTGAPAWIAAYVLAIVGVFFVNRWWALLPAIVPVAVNSYIHQYTDYEPPYREEGISFSSAIPLLILAVLFVAAVLSIGLGARALADARGSSVSDDERPGRLI
jgi:hypothetical protein